MAVKKETTEIKKEEPKKYFFGILTNNGNIDYVKEDLITEEQFTENIYDSDYKYFRIDPIHIEKITIETKIIKA